MKKLSQSGFSAVEALLVVILLGILVGTGLYVYHAQNSANKTLDIADKTAASQTQTIKRKSSTNSTAASSSDKIEMTTYSKLPTAFKSAYVTHAKTGGSTCVDADGNPINDAGQAYDPAAKYISGKFVSVGECNAAAIYALQNGAWVFVQKTDFEYSCDALTKYHVPASLVMIGTSPAICLDSSNKEVAYE